MRTMKKKIDKFCCFFDQLEEFLLSSVILINFSCQIFDIKELGGGTCKPHINFTNETQN
jgi:hypothetical protein